MIYKNIILITDTEIIKQIFTLVCNKLSLNLEIYSDDININKTDILIYEDLKYDKDNIIRYKSMCETLAVIAKQRVYEYEGAFLIKKPFLPSQLVNYISELIDSLKYQEKEQIKNSIKIEDMSGEVDDLVDFIDSIDEFKEDEYFEKNDIEISASDLGHGGVLDKKELDKLHDIISDNTNNTEDNTSINYNNDAENWLELNDIIDDVIDDIADNDIADNDDILLVLNKFTMDELAPLLNKLDQDSIDKLSTGVDLKITLRLEK